MVEAGVIRERHSLYCSLVTIVTRKDVTPRLCIDFHLNCGNSTACDLDK